MPWPSHLQVVPVAGGAEGSPERETRCVWRREVISRPGGMEEACTNDASILIPES